MNKKFKTIGAAVLAAAMCASFAGCANNETSSTGKIENSSKQNSKSNSSSQNSTESKTESANTSDNGSKSESEEANSLSEITVAATDEILNAKFESGLVQYYNDMFQCGCYVSASEFIEKYKLSYDFKITYGTKLYTLDDTGELLIEPSLSKGEMPLGEICKLRGKPKFTVKGSEDIEDLLVELVNPTDKPITYSECYVDYVWTNGYSYFTRAGGVSEIDTNAAEYLKSLGYEEITNPETNQRGELKAAMDNNKKLFKDNNGNYRFYDVGEPNPAGIRPFYVSMITSGGRIDAPSDVYYIK